MPQRLVAALPARRSRARVRTALLAVGTTVAALTSVVAAGSAPASAATGCGSYSTLDCSAVAPTLPLNLDFTADAGGYAATGSGSIGTGFTMDQPSSNGGSYLPTRLTENPASPGTLTVAATPGSAYLTSSSGGNSLDNGLGVGVDAADKTLTISTTVVNVPSTKNAGEGQGLWFGPDEDDYLKLGFVATSGAMMKPQLAREIAGVSSSAATDERDGAAVTATGGSAVFNLVIDPVKLTATATYTFQGTLHTIGSLTIPSSFVDGSALSTTIAHTTSFAGIFASERRNTSVSTGLPFGFDTFSVSGTDLAAPPAPAAPTASQVSGGVGLSWPADAARDVVGYNVYRSTTSTVPTTGTPLNGASPVSGLAYTDTTATAGNTYYYAVTAVDDAGKVSPASAAVSIQTGGDTTPPAAPGPPTLTAGTSDIKLSWTASSAADTAGYRVYRSTSTPVDTSGAPASGSALLTGTTYDDTAVVSNTTYYYVVVAVDRSGNVSAPSGASSAHLVDLTAPAAPAGITATPAGGSIGLSWTANTEPDLAGYSVYRSTTSTVPINSSSVVSGSALLSTPSFTDTGLPAGTTYYYAVVAVDTAGNVSSPSATVSATTFAPNSGALTVTNLDGLPALPSPYRMEFNRIQSPVDANQAVHDTATTRLGNSGSSAITVTALTLTGPYALVSAPTLPATIAPGGTLDVTIKFTATTGGSKGSQESGSLAISSNAGTNPSPSIDLEGWWQALSEHSLEPLLPDVKSMFGLNVTLPTQIDEAGEYKAFSTDEILSPYWRKLDSSKPVTVNEIAAYHTYPTVNYIQTYVKGATTFSSFASSGKYQAQSVFPRTASTTTPTAPSSGSINPTGAFGIKVDAEYGDAALNVQSTDRSNGCTTTLCGSHVRAFRLHNADGSLLTGSYLIVEDAGGVNYDYNDNVYIMNNVQPESTGIPTGVTATGGNAQAAISWSAVSGSDVKGYNLYSSTGSATPSGSSTPLNGSTLLTGTSYTATGLTNLTAYNFAVQTVYQNGAKSDLSAAAAATPHDSSKFSANINFQSAAAPVPSGYYRDYGQAYGARTDANEGSGLTYGWVVPDTHTPKDLSVGGSTPGNGRDRNLVSDQRYDTLFYMQPPSSFDGTRAPGSWEIAVPNGTYQVLVAVGDPLVSSTASNMVLNVEGTNAVTGFNPTGANGSATTNTSKTVTVTVTDGRLTVDADGGTNTRIDFIQINQM